MKAWDMMLAIAKIEEQCVELRKLTCDGNFVHGHTVNTEKAEQNAQQVGMRLGMIGETLNRAVSHYMAEE